MREAYPKGIRVHERGRGAVYRALCPLCAHVYVWGEGGNRRCPACGRAVPVSERPLLPEEEATVGEILVGLCE